MKYFLMMTHQKRMPKHLQKEKTGKTTDSKKARSCALFESASQATRVHSHSLSVKEELNTARKWSRCPIVVWRLDTLILSRTKFLSTNQCSRLEVSRKLPVKKMS